MVVLPPEGDVRPLGSIAEVLRLLRVPPTLWEAFLEQVGNRGTELRVLARYLPMSLSKAWVKHKLQGKDFQQ